MSLAILSMEEAGKACLIKWKADGYIKRDIMKDIRSGHVAKQRILGVFRWAKAIKDVVDGQKNRNLRQSRLEKLAQKRVHKKSMMTIHRAETGTYDGIKQTGFYTDIDDDLSVMMPYDSFSKADADFHIAEAFGALKIIESPAVMHSVMADLYESGEVHNFTKKRPAIFRDLIRDEARKARNTVDM